MGRPRVAAPPSSAESELHAAARSGDLPKVEAICNSNPLAVNLRDRHSRTPYPLSLSLESFFFFFFRLHLAAWSGHAEVVSYLCKNKADVGAAAMDDTGAIHFASQKGHLEVVRTLLSSGVSVKATNRKGFTALHYAVQGSHPELIKYLVRKGAKLDAKTKAGETPSDLAKEEGIRSLLVECEQAPKKEEQSTTSKKDDDLVPERSPAHDGTSSDAKDLGTTPQDEENGAREKRKGDVVPEESSLKKARVSLLLQHLVAEDDAPDEEDE